MSRASASNFVTAQLRFLEANVPHEPKTDDTRSVLSDDVEDLVAHALATFDSIKRRRKGVGSTAPREGNVELETEAWLAEWQAFARRLLHVIESLEGQRRDVARSGELRFAINEATLALQGKQIAAAFERLERGEGRDLEEFAHELPGEVG
jgi:hypothetical protein